MVTIDDTDYDSLFGGRSPLNPDTLAHLVRAVARGRPRVIGIDIETSDPSFEPLRQLADSIRGHAGASIVWARDAEPCPEAAEGTTPAPRCAAELIRPLDVLGGKVMDGLSGLVVVALDPGGTIRRFRPVQETTEGRLPLFAWAIWRAFDPVTAVPFDSSSVRFVSFHQLDSGALHFSARQLLQAEPTAGYQGGVILGDKIVLIGGAYRAGRDEHHTPVGILQGVQIQAQMVETVLSGGGARVPSLLQAAVLQFLIGTALALALAHFRKTRALLLGFAAAAGLAVLGSVMLTGSATAGLPFFVPLATLMIVHHLTIQVGAYRELFVEEALHHATGSPSEERVGNVVARADALIAAAGEGGVLTSRRFWHWLQQWFVVGRANASPPDDHEGPDSTR